MEEKSARADAIAVAMARRDLLFMDHLGGNEAHGDARGVVASEHGREPDQSGRSEQDGKGRMKANGQDEKMQVEYEEEEQGKKKAEHETRETGEQAEDAGFGEDQFAELGTGGAEIAEKAEFAAAVDDEREESACHAEYGDKDGDGFECVGNGEGAIEN